jgi:hypothetical protein
MSYIHQPELTFDYDKALRHSIEHKIVTICQINQSKNESLSAKMI